MNIIELTQDVIDLFSRKRGGHISRYCYGGFVRPDGSTGSGLWHSFVEGHEGYYPIRGESALMPAFLQGLDDDYDSVVDFGIGDDKAIDGKMLPVLEKMKQLKYFTAIDYSEEHLNTGVDYVRKKRPDLQAEGINGDFYDVHKIQGLKRIGFLLGPNISNQDMLIGGTLPFDTIVERLKVLAQTVRVDDGGCLVVSFDRQAPLSEAFKAYEHPDWGRMIAGIMHDLGGILELEGDYKPSSWVYDPVLDEENHVIQHAVRATEDQDFSVADQGVQIKSGETFPIVNSFKFPHEVFMDMIEASGLKPNRVVAESDDHPMVFVEATA